MNQERFSQTKSRLILLLVLITTPILGATTDIYVPSLPAISKFFSSGVEITRLSVPAYLLAYGIFQIVFGAFADSFGRRNVIIFSLICFVITTLSVPNSSSIYTLLLLRALQGVFAAGIGVSLRSIISDTFSGIKLKKYASYTAVAWGVGPVLSPNLGGYLQHMFGWTAPFYFLTAYTFIMMLAAVFWLPETILQKHKFHIQVISSNYFSLLKSPPYIAAALICGLTYGIITIYNVAGPFLIEDTLGHSPIVYGRVALFLGVGWFIGNFTVRFIVSRHSLQTISLSIMSFYLVFALLLLVFALTGVFNLWTTTIPPIFLFIAGGVLFALYFGHALSLHRHIGGAAAALLGSIFSLIAGIMSAVGSWLPTKSLFPLSASYLALLLLIFVAYITLVPKEK